MQELERLIEKFWADQTTQAENKRLIQLLEQEKGNYQDALRDKFQRKEQLTPGLQPEKALSLLRNIHQDLGLEELKEKQQTKRASVRSLVLQLTVAASICIITVSVYLLSGRHPEKKQIAKAVAPPSALLTRMVNGSDSAITINLKDGSTVQLGKKSSLSWYEPFIDDRRDITLSGTALFKVAKDRTKPFTVYAGGIATRALGTRFWVNAADTRKIMVQLLEGKVVVNAVAGSGMTINNVYLAPGQELSYDKRDQHYAVNSVPARPGRPGHLLPPPDNKPELVFRKEPLGMVFQRICHLYKVPLTFREEELDGLYFTGTFLRSDDLNLVLTTICNVNDLHFTKEQDSIIITKQH
jgi:transmembrane sensor